MPCFRFGVMSKAFANSLYFITTILNSLDISYQYTKEQMTDKVIPNTRPSIPSSHLSSDYDCIIIIRTDRDNSQTAVNNTASLVNNLMILYDSHIQAYLFDNHLQLKTAIGYYHSTFALALAL